MRTRSHKTWLAALGAALALAAGATAGTAIGAPARPAGQSPIEKAANKTAKASTFAFSFRLTVSGGGSSIPGGSISLSGSGAVNTVHKSAKISVNLGALASSLGAAAGGTALPAKIDVVVVNGVVYAHVPSLAKQLGGPGKEWLKLDTKALPKSKTGGVDTSQLSKVNAQQALAALTASVSVKKLGSDTIGGQPATHYRATLDVAKAVKVLPASQRASVLKGAKQAGLTSIPVDFWINGAGYLRRIALALGPIKSQGSPPVSFKLTADIFNFGGKVGIAVPPAAKTADASKLLTQLVPSVGG
ncbi:MAG TPA: hypothetical protein VFA44_08435 [Gaiellaceae bacterium]|nr:hypothetical protein [Gaiellaceae bacterium]